MSFIQRQKEGKIAPILKSKLEQLSGRHKSNSEAIQAENGHATASASMTESTSRNAPRIVVIGAGSRGCAYARAIKQSKKGIITAICEPNDTGRLDFARKYILDSRGNALKPHQQFRSWPDFITYEQDRRERVAAKQIQPEDQEWTGADAAFICVLDHQHVQAVRDLSPLGLHIMCEKPLATSLADCMSIYASVTNEWEKLGKKTIFSICHVLRYSPHNTLLRKLVREDNVIGDVISIEHTEPVGWWHFTHSYVRGNWRRSDTSAPSLLTKSCHDIDFLLWMLCSSKPGSNEPPHLPSTLMSTGRLSQFRKARKPSAAGDATNCLQCPISETCNFSAKNIYLTKHFDRDDFGWPVKIVLPDIEDIVKSSGKETARAKLVEKLGEDYNSKTADEQIKGRNWFGRCVWEADNDVCDDQTVTVNWDDDPLPDEDNQLRDRGAKSAVFHMIAPTDKICERRGKIYGTRGEISYDSFTIDVHDFTTGITTTYEPPRTGGGHGGGDDGLAMNFLKAVQAVKDGELDAVAAQRLYLGCSLDEVIRSHVAVFAAEKARSEARVVQWSEFWQTEVEGRLKELK